MAAYSQDVLLEFFCRLRSEAKSTNQHLFCSACIISHSGLTYCAVKVLGRCGENKSAESSGKQLCRYSMKHAGNLNVVTGLLQL